MLCALLIFDGPAFPAPLDEVSPWLDICIRPLAEVTAALAAQTHRRFIKTHTPLDGLPWHADVTYLVVGRDPRDVAISFEHHAANMDFERFLELRAAAVGNADLAELPQRRVPSEDPVERFRTFLADETPGAPPTLASVLHHLDTGWQRRREPNVALFHYADLQADLRVSCSAWRASSGSRAHRNARVSSRRRRAWPGCASAVPTSRRTHRRERWKDVSAFFRSGGIRRVARAPLRRRPRRLRGAGRGARRPGSRRLGARRPARFGRRSRTLIRPRATSVVPDGRCACPSERIMPRCQG